jgi:hypothetical protein
VEYRIKPKLGYKKSLMGLLEREICYDIGGHAVYSLLYWKYFKNEQIYSKKTNINLKIINPRNRLNKNLKLV